MEKTNDNKQIKVNVHLFWIYYLFSALFMLGYYLSYSMTRNEPIEVWPCIAISASGYVTMPAVLGIRKGYNDAEQLNRRDGLSTTTVQFTDSLTTTKQ